MTGKCNMCGFVYDDEADPRDTNALLMVVKGKPKKKYGCLVCPKCLTDNYLMDDSENGQKIENNS